MRRRWAVVTRCGQRTGWHARPMAIPALERGSLADRSADAMRKRILSRAVKPGQRLESLRELAAELGVSLAVAREAISRLKGEGLVEVRHGIGTFVARKTSAARVLRAARLRASRAEMEELRLAVDPAVARAAVRHSDGGDIDDLLFALGGLEVARTSADPVAYVRADVAFHLAVARASRNGLGIGFHRMGTRLLQPNLAARAAEHARNRELNELHRALFTAIDEGRPWHAERAARKIAAIEAQPT